MTKGGKEEGKKKKEGMTNQARVSLHTPLFQLAFIFTPAYAHRDFAPSTLFSLTTTDTLPFQNSHLKFDLRTDWSYFYTQ